MKAVRYSYDVFISYRWVDPDRNWTRNKLVPALERAGLSVCIDYEDFGPGRGIIDEMDKSGIRSRHVLAVVGPDYCADGHMTNLEWRSARERDMTGGTSTLIPMVVRKTPINELLDGYVPIDYTGTQDECRQQWIKLLQTLGARRLTVAAPTSVVEMLRHVNPHRHGNYMLLSRRRGFTQKLRSALLARGDELGIQDDQEEMTGDEFDYMQGLDTFLKDPSPNAKWLFTIYPDTKFGKMSLDDMTLLAGRLNATHKKIVFFESGLDIARQINRHRVFSIHTNFGAAVRILINMLDINFVNGGGNMHFVTLLGPRCSVADVRRKIYNEYLATAQLAYGCGNSDVQRDDAGLFQQQAGNLISMPLQITSIPVGTWDRADALARVREFCAITDSSPYKTCFLCGNDDLAMGARDAVLAMGCQKAIDEGRVVFVGFDGLDKFVELIRSERCGATIRVDMAGMVEQAVEILQNGGKSPMFDFPIPSRIIAPEGGFGKSHQYLAEIVHV
jgi:hypothetical protein